MSLYKCECHEEPYLIFGSDPLPDGHDWLLLVA